MLLATEMAEEHSQRRMPLPYSQLDEGRDVVMGSQEDLFDEEDESNIDAFTQARTQVEGLFIHDGQEKIESEIPKFCPKPTKEQVILVRRGYSELLAGLQRT